MIVYPATRCRRPKKDCKVGEATGLLIKGLFHGNPIIDDPLDLIDAGGPDCTNSACMTIRKKVLGEEHPDFGASLNNQVGLYESQGRHEEAEPLLKQAMAIRKEAVYASPSQISVLSEMIDNF